MPPLMRWVIMSLLTLMGIYLYHELKSYGRMITIRSPIDNREYRVRNIPGRKFAADRLATIRATVTRFINHLTTKYPRNQAVSRLKDKFCTCILFENDPDTSRHTTFTYNKCENMGICMREQVNGKSTKFTPFNTIMFVILHELAHVMSISNDPNHITQEFSTNFKFILNSAIEEQIWEYQNYSNYPVSYCGTIIKTTPLLK